MQSNTIHSSGHTMFTNTVMDIVASIITITTLVKNLMRGDPGIVRPGQICRTAKQYWTGRHDSFDRFLAGDTCCQLLWFSGIGVFQCHYSIIYVTAEIACHGGVKSSGGCRDRMSALPGFTFSTATVASVSPV